MKRYLSIFILILFVNIAYSQNFVITWEKCYGGTNDDITRSIIPYNDGYLVLGTTKSHDGDISYNPVSNAAWLIELDKHGEILFDTCYPGFGWASACKIIEGDSEYFYLFGDGATSDQNESGYWIAKADTNFNILWQDMIGGSYIENSRGGCIAYDGGIIVSGITSSHDGDVEEYYGNFDNWLVKLKANGDKDWVKTFGNFGGEEGGRIIRTSDGGYLYVSSGYNELPGNTYCEGCEDQKVEAWIIKLNDKGEKEWHRCYGGSYIDVLTSPIELDDGYIVLGSSESPDGDINNFHGQAGISDVWVLKTDFKGDIMWSKCYGGTNSDGGVEIVKNNDNTFTILANTKSKNGDISENNAPSNNNVTWFIKIDENGNLLYEKVFDQFPYHGSASIVKVSEYKYVLAGYETDFGCNFTPGNQNNDIYIFEIQDMDEFIPLQPIGADKVCLKTTQESYYSTELVVDTMETQWLLIPEEAGTLTQLHDSVFIQWNQEFADTACLQVRAVNEYGESSYSETKEIIVYPPLEFANINGADSVCSANNHQSIYTTQIEDNNNINWYLEPETAGEIQNQQDTVIIIWNPTFEGTAHLKIAAINTCEEDEYSMPKEIQVKTCTGVEEQNNKQLKFYPNPASSQITFELPQINKESFLYIKDIFGKTIARLSLIKTQSQLIWDCSTISQGVYFYQTEINGEVYRGKIVVN